MIATLTRNHEWHVAEGSKAPRLAREGERLELRHNELVWLAEPHGAVYRLICHLSPSPAGIEVASRVEAGSRPFEKKYFLKAQ
jgi:hypothetical protein